MSKRLTHLKREIGTLREQFLPDPFIPLGVYPKSARVQAHTRAFLVLSHAEIESFLEEWAKDIARASEVVWLSSHKITEPLGFLLATLAERIDVPVTLLDPTVKDSQMRLAEESVKLFQRYYKRIKANHGIKERNILALFAPLGLASAAVGSTLLPNLDYLGALRGTHAHNSAKAVLSWLDPETEYKRVTDLLVEILILDQWLVDYKRRIR